MQVITYQYKNRKYVGKSLSPVNLITITSANQQQHKTPRCNTRVEAGYGGRSAHGRSVILDNIEYSSAKKSVIMHCMLHNCSGVVYIYIHLGNFWGYHTLQRRTSMQAKQHDTSLNRNISLHKLDILHQKDST
jgi:hypothetical protein